MRAFFDEFQRYYSGLPDSLMLFGCSPALFKNPHTKGFCETLDDSRKAVELTGNFFINILKTPDHLCALAKVDTPNETESVSRLADLIERIPYMDDLPKSCFDPLVKEHFKGEGYVVRGEVRGHFLNHVREFNPSFNYSSDRSVLGIWMDKLLATKFLNQRYHQKSNDVGFKNYLDFGSIGKNLTDLYSHYLGLKKLDTPFPFVNEKGEVYAEKSEYDFGFDETINTKDIFFPSIYSLFDLPTSGEVSIQKAILKNAQKWQLANGGNGVEDFRKSAESISINKRANDETKVDSTLFHTLPNGDSTIYFSQDNTLASSATARIAEFSLMEKLGKDQVTKILDGKRDKPYLKDLTETEKKVFTFKKGLLEGVIKEKMDHPEMDFPKIIDIMVFQGESPDIHERLLSIFNEIGSQRIEQILKLQTDYKNNLAGDSQDLKILVNLPKPVLESFLDGSYKEKVANILTAISNLPEMPRPN
jgi:hypothetical protein